MFDRLLASIPTGGDADEEMRAVLRPIVERILAGLPSVDPVPYDPSTCPNCGVLVSSLRTPYCEVHCREMAGFIRQFRGAMRDESLFSGDRQLGTAQALWSLQGGGFPRRQLMITPKIVAKVIAKAGGICSVCGAPAVGVDHAGSACNRTSNLRAVCASCNRASGFGAPLSPSVLALYDEVALRIGSAVPIRCCDDPVEWDWRGYLGERKSREG